MIASTADDKSKNTLDTGTISFEDIKNKADYKVDSVNVNVGLGQGNGIGYTPSASTPSVYHNDGKDSSTTKSAVEGGNLIVRDTDKQQQDVNDLSRDTENANNPLGQIFNKQKEQDRIDSLNLVKDITAQAKDVANKYGSISAELEYNALTQAEKVKKDVEAAKSLEDQKIDISNLSEKERDKLLKDESIRLISQGKDFGNMGDSFSKGIDAASSIVSGIITGDISGGLAGASAPYLAGLIKEYTYERDEKGNKKVDENGDYVVNKEANLIAHAILGGAVAAAQGNSALAGATGAVSGEAAVGYIKDLLYGKDTKISDLTQVQKENLSNLAQIASGLAVASVGGSTSDVGTAIAGSKNAVENNRLATLEEQKRIDELAKDNEREKLFYQAAACALINCSAEFADDDPMKGVYQKLEELGSSNELQAYREALAVQEYIKTNIVPDVNGFYPITYETAEKLFEYTSGDKFLDSVANINNEYSVATRLGGTLQVGFAVGEGALAITLSPSCATVAGCAPSALLSWSAIDNGMTGVSVIIDGKSYTTQTGKGLSKLLNISESDGDLLFSAATGLVSAKGLGDLASSSLYSGNKLTAKELETIKSEVDRVGKLTVDPHAGKVKLAEGSAAADLEKLLGGKVERINDKDSLADFVFTSGPNKGKTVDFMFTTANGTEKEINAMNQFFNNNWNKNVEKLHEHLDKADIVPLDFRKLTLENQQKFENYIKILSKSEQSKIYIMR